jgi:hypothetical protein
LYIDSLLTLDRSMEKDELLGIIEFITAFFEMFRKWLYLVPRYADFYPKMKANPYLYLVCPEAAILNLSKSFISSLELIFGQSPRSERFFSECSSTLSRLKSFPRIKNRRLNICHLYFMDAFINTKCLKELASEDWLGPETKIDLSTICKLLSSIACIFTGLDHTAEEVLEFIATVNGFVFGEEGISAKVINLPVGEIKDLNEKDVISVVRSYFDLSEEKISKDMYIYKLRLNLYFNFLKGPFLEK